MPARRGGPWHGRAFGDVRPCRSGRSIPMTRRCPGGQIACMASPSITHRAAAQPSAACPCHRWPSATGPIRAPPRSSDWSGEGRRCHSQHRPAVPSASADGWLGAPAGGPQDTIGGRGRGGVISRRWRNSLRTEASQPGPVQSHARASCPSLQACQLLLARMLMKLYLSCRSLDDTAAGGEMSLEKPIPDPVPPQKLPRSGMRVRAVAAAARSSNTGG